MSPLTRRNLLTGLSASLITPTLAAPAIAKSTISQHVSHIQVRKSARKVDLIGGGRVLRSYDMRLGFSPVGKKRFQGDGKTPEGAYRIDRRNPQSKFYRSIGISYPNRHDIAYAQAHGRSPGGAIFIHGQVNGRRHTQQHDWTLGCVAVSNSDMDEIWRFVPVGCGISLFS